MPDPQLLFDAETIEELKKDHRWWKIYEESIPESEREPRSIIFEGMERGVSKAFRARLQGETVGMSSIHLFHHPAMVFLGLLAIAPEKRDHHIGGSLFEYAFAQGCDALREKGFSPLGMVWEIDDPAQARTPEDKSICERRIDFYRHHQGEILPWPYILPPMQPGNSPLPMLLMFRPCDREFKPDAGLRMDVLWTIYFEKYYAVNGIEQAVLEKLYKKLERQ